MVDVPLTFPAHQVAVLPLKLWKPRWFDGIALVVGSGSPDLFNALAAIDTFDSHEANGIVVAVAFTIIYSVLLRRFAVDGLFASLPDFGPLRARSYRVLANGRPRLLVTSLSAFIGVASHVFVDSFTHRGRFGSNLLGLNDTLVELPLVGGVTGAGVLQYLGHTVGSLVGVILFVLVVSRRHLGEWYGEDEVDRARTAPVGNSARKRLVGLVTIAWIAGAVWGIADGDTPVFHMGLTTVIALLLAGILNTPRGGSTRDLSPERNRIGIKRGTNPDECRGTSTVGPCLDTCTHRATMSSTSSGEHSPKI